MAATRSGVSTKYLLMSPTSFKERKVSIDNNPEFETTGDVCFADPGEPDAKDERLVALVAFLTDSRPSKVRPHFHNAEGFDALADIAIAMRSLGLGSASINPNPDGVIAL